GACSAAICLRAVFGRTDRAARKTYPILCRRKKLMPDTRQISPEFAISPPPVASLPISGSDKVFPINRVFCIGRNYAAHAVEMGHDPDREPPFFFFKSPGNLTSDGTFAYPPLSSD